MNTSDYVENLTDEIRYQIIKDFEEFEKQGFIEECTLRSETEKYMKIANIQNYSIIIMMSFLAFECYRYYFYKNKGQS